MFTVSIDLTPVKNIVKECDPNGKVQKFFTNELWRWSDDYVPMNSTVLKTQSAPTPDGTCIRYSAPYARYHWFGKLMVDPVYNKGAFFSQDYGFWSRPGVQKVLTDIDLSYQGAPIRGPRWCERAFIDHQDEIIKATADYAARLK